MAMVRFMFLVLFLAWEIPRDCAGQRYAILTPFTVRPHTTYDLVVTNLEDTTKQYFFDIVDPNEKVVGTSSVSVSPHELREVQISLAALRNQNYTLKVSKDHRQALVNATKLEYIDRSYLVLFQTDKPAYKPGDTVLFRVIFLFLNAFPVTSTAGPTIYITDPEKYRMKQWINATLSSGVFEGSFQLAEYTTLGLWTIDATLDGQNYKEYFRVEEYILPLFKIQIESTPKPYFHCNDQYMSINVTASFANGRSVQGNATVVVRANYNNYLTETKEVDRKGIFIKGKTTVRFPMNPVAKNCDEERNVWFDVYVTENSTGITYNHTSLLMVRNTGDVTMEVLDRNDAFYPGLPLKLKVKLATLDGKPEAGRNITITSNLKEQEIGYDGEIDMKTRSPKIISEKTNNNGIIKFTIATTKKTAIVTVEGSYSNQTFPLVSAYPKYEDSSVEYLTVHTHAAYHAIGKNISIELNANVNFTRIYYIGYCYGTVCESGVKEWSEGTRKKFVLTAKPVMKPQMKLLVFTVIEDGTILSSTTIIRIQPTVNSSFNITKPVNEKLSGKYIFNITAEIDAFVGILGVDERVIQRSTINNDISQRKLEMAIQGQEDAAGVMWPSYDSFESVGVLLLTDGHLPDVGFVPHLFSVLERTGTDPEDISTRKDFPETWIWKSFKIPKSGKLSFEESLPDTMTTWVVNGFSVGPKNGLQLLKKPLEIIPTKRIFVELFMPPSIKRFEEVTVHCLVHNSGNNDIYVILEKDKKIIKHGMYIGKGDTKSVPIKIRSDAIGTLTVEITVKAQNRTILDALRQTIPVRPEGLMQTVEDVRILDFRQSTSMTFNLTLPAIEGVGSINSGEVTLSVTGTILNLDFFDLEQMVKSSHGNGEENLLFLQTAMAVYEYLENLEQLQSETKDKLLSHMEVAYQQLLQYRLDDGSYSMFGSLYECGGVWFTASTVESLQKLSKFISVEKSLLSEGLNWLVAQSQEDGTFNETCTIVHPHIQRTGGKELSLASSILFAFVGSERVQWSELLVNKTVSLLLRDSGDDVYLLAKTTYLLTLMRHPNVPKLLKKLNTKAVTDGNYRYWRVLNTTASAHVREQETTAYALLANIRRKNISQFEMIQVAKWLQKHSFAGDHYVPSLERIIALQALGLVASELPKTVYNMRIKAEDLEFQVNSTNKQLLQSSPLPNFANVFPNIRSIKVSATGSGFVVMKLSYRYSRSNASLSARESAHSIPNGRPILVEKSAEDNTLTLRVCPRLNLWLQKQHDSNLWKAIIVVPTGYEIAGQHADNANTTMSTTLLEQKSRLEIVFEGQYEQNVCYWVSAYTGQWVNVTHNNGMIYLYSFNTKDVVDARSF